MKSKLLFVLLLLGIVVLAETGIKVPRPCIVDVQLMPETECHGPSMDHLICQPLKMTLRKNCAVIEVNPEKQYGQTK